MKKTLCLVLSVLLAAMVLPGTIPAGRYFPGNEAEFRFLFYNVENLFDTLDQPGIGDDEFIPGSARDWNGWKYRHKLQRIFQVIASAGGWEPPEIIGLCEVENKRVVEDLFRYTPLAKVPYGIVHEESPDERGIDLALAYRTDRFTLLEQESWPVTGESGERLATRSVLHVTGVAPCGKKIHLVLTHWPSRFNLPQQRMMAAKTIASRLDSVFISEPEALLILAGDFNDNPDDPAPLFLREKLGLVNLVKESAKNLEDGSIKYQGNWYWFDQVMLSRGLMDGRGLDWIKGSFRLVDDAFLFEKDMNYSGNMPFRSFSGYRYQGGYSDHLPVMAVFGCLP